MLSINFSAAINNFFVNPMPTGKSSAGLKPAAHRHCNLSAAGEKTKGVNLNAAASPALFDVRRWMLDVPRFQPLAFSLF
jgi:hypothetical protein